MTPAEYRVALSACLATFELLERECEDHDASVIAAGAARQIRGLLNPVPRTVRAATTTNMTRTDTQ